MDNNHLSSYTSQESADAVRPGRSFGVRIDDDAAAAQPRSAVRYGSGTRYADSSQTTATHGSTSLLLSIMAFLLMVMVPLLFWLVIPCLCVVAFSLYFSYKALRGTRRGRRDTSRLYGYGGLLLSFVELAVIVVMALGVALWNNGLPY